MTDTAALVDLAPWVPEDTFGSRLALIRQHFHWNVSEAAKATGIAPATWTTWEEGSSPRDYIATCEKIAAKVGCSTKWLVEGHKNWKQLTPPDLRLLVNRQDGGSAQVDASEPEQLKIRLLHSVPDLTD